LNCVAVYAAQNTLFQFNSISINAFVRGLRSLQAGRLRSGRVFYPHASVIFVFFQARKTSNPNPSEALSYDNK